VAALATLLVSAQAAADDPARRATANATSSPASASESIQVRVALSKAAAKRLFTLRVRRLLDIELDGVATVEAASHGPLAGDIIRVWIDVPNPRRAVIEVRRAGRSLARHQLAIGGFPSDVAARVVVIAASEMVRVQAELGQQVQPPANDNTEPSGEDEDAALAFGAGLTGLILPGTDPGLLFGSELALEHRRGISAQTLYGRWLFGEGALRLRWLEVGAAVDVRAALSPVWRLRFGARAGGVALAIPNAALIDGAPATSDWTARAAALVGVEAALLPSSWATLSLEPGAMLRSIAVTDREGDLDDIGGFALAVNLGLVTSPF